MSTTAEDQGQRTDPIHNPVSRRAEWTTVNAAEALPGVATPLSWTWFAEASELAMRGGFADIGVLTERDVRMVTDPEDRFINIFYGRLAINVDMMRRMGDRIPGSSGDAVEEQFFSGSREPHPAAPPSPSGRTIRRLPIIAVKLPLGAIRARRTLLALDREVTQWWQQTVGPGSTETADEARAAFQAAQGYLLKISRASMVINMIAQGLYEQTRRLCLLAGKPGLELRLTTADRDVSESRLIGDLWDLAHQHTSLPEFLDKQGFHGPAEGQLSSHSWREDHRPLTSQIASYASLPDRPTDIYRGRATERLQAETELLSGLNRIQRACAAVVLRLARTYLPLREDTRNTFLKAYDVARCMARRIGGDLVTNELLGDQEDVFHLTAAELLGALPADVRSEIEFRKARRERYLQLTLPERWHGEPDPVCPATSSSDANQDADEPIVGMGVSAGVVEGRAVVVLDPSDPDALCPGDILVCHTTDPSWATIFFLVAGCVIDVGGPISHGAIVARELGLPCVINTRVGTQRLSTGDHIRIDGSAGTVEILEANR